VFSHCDRDIDLITQSKTLRPPASFGFQFKIAFACSRRSLFIKFAAFGFGDITPGPQLFASCAEIAGIAQLNEGDHIATFHAATTTDKPTINMHSERLSRLRFMERASACTPAFAVRAAHFP
jgi:hypothetical protein